MKILRSIYFVMASLLMSSVCARADVKAPATSLIRVLPAAGMDTSVVARVATFCSANTLIESRVDAAKDFTGDTLEARAKAAGSLVQEGDFTLVVLTLMPASEKRHGYVDPLGRVIVINVTPMKTEDAEVYGRRLERQVMRGVYTLLGLKPCPNPFCCMHPYKEIKDLDRLGRNACPPCGFNGQKAARKAGVKLMKPTLPKGAMPTPPPPPPHPPGRFFFVIKILREAPERVRTALVNRGASVDLDRLLACDRLRRETTTEVEELKRQRNSASKEIGKRKSQGEDAAEQMQAVRELGERITQLDAQRSRAAEEAQDLLMAIPNLPEASVPVGSDESANPVLRTWGEAASFDFEPLPHWELGDKLGIFDFARAARMSGSGFSMLIGAGSRLSRALVQFMLDLHTTEHGYTEVLPPFLANSDALRGTGQLPKFPEEMYHIPSDDLWLIPTAEVPLTNLCREEILEAPLPVALTAYTPCFRREAGAAGKMTRGLNRVHQFDKVEMVRMVDPAQSFAELELLTGHAEAVLQRLGLHYRVIELCTGDIGFSSAKTYDLELWAPGQQAWLEVSSCSNFVDFQARRAQIRYRDEKGKPAYVHTLNGSGVALPRLMVAILENGQQADGSVILPEAIRPYMGGMDRIMPPDPS